MVKKRTNNKGKDRKMTEKDKAESGVKLIEVFNTWQGEGPDSGRSMLILRFKTCNLKCSWCDTRVKMRITPEAEYSISQLQDIINENMCGILVTGGEPTVPRHFDDCVKLIKELKYPIANVETNGFNIEELIDVVFQNPHPNVRLIYSPKIFDRMGLDVANSKTEYIINTNLYDGVNFKIVYEHDNRYIQTYLKRLSEQGINESVYLMPEGTNRADLIRNASQVFDACEKYKFNFSSRTHIIYGFV